MSEKLNNKIVEILKDLETNIAEIRSSFVCSTVGLPIASASPELDLTKLAAETSAILTVSEHTAHDSGSGSINNIIIQAEDNILVITSASTEAVLSVKADKDVKLGLLLYDIKKTAKRLEKVFNENM
ncbi:MAG: hypothetical protein GF329_14240 [Candidatus Lokiarchaeota archaeon]|nr:hypothetical protein [Candidatus Lokiarchaeota archaeon]